MAPATAAALPHPALGRRELDVARLDGLRVDVYWNLHRHCSSLRHRGLVIAHADEVVLTDVAFVVNAAGRERVLRERAKNVHAFVRGHVSTRSPAGNGTPVRYNPYESDRFRTLDGPVEGAEAVSLQIRDGRPLMLIGASGQ